MTRPAEYPACPLPRLAPTVVECRLEDPTFAEVLGRARARALDVPYRPEVHYPWRPAGPSHDRVDPEHAARLDEIIERWSRGARPNPYLRRVR